MKSLKIGIVIAAACFLCACAHFKTNLSSVFHSSSQENTCANIQRQMLFTSTASGNKSQWDVQSERMQLEHLYRQEKCDEVMQKNSVSPTTSTKTKPQHSAS